MEMDIHAQIQGEKFIREVEGVAFDIREVGLYIIHIYFIREEGGFRTSNLKIFSQFPSLTESSKI